MATKPFYKQPCTAIFAGFLTALGDSQEIYYRLDWSDEDVPFGQERIPF